MPRFGPYSDDVGHQTNGVQAWRGQPRYSAIASNETITRPTTTTKTRTETRTRTRINPKPSVIPPSRNYSNTIRISNKHQDNASYILSVGPNAIWVDVKVN